jgi:hypothetical protein
VPFSAPPTPHGAVDLHDVLFREQTVNLHGHLRADGGEIDEAFYALAFDHAALAGGDIERGLQRGQARHHGLDLVGDVLW